VRCSSNLRKPAATNTLSSVADSFKEFEATSLFCSRCRQATPVRKRLLLVLPTGNKYDYTCSVCGSAVGGKTDNDTTDFYGTTPAVRRAPRGTPPRLR
jgi:hypothetical protein